MRHHERHGFTDRLGFRRFYNVQKVLPAVYDDSLSYYELLAKIQCKLGEVIEFYNKLAEYQDVQDKALQDAYDSLVQQIADAKAELKQLIDSLEGSSLDWDVQYGCYTETTNAMRDMFNDVTVHSYNLEQLDTLFDILGMDVDGLANCGLNVKGFAVVNHFLLRPDGPTSDVISDRERAAEILTVNDLGETLLDPEGYLYVTPQNGRS